MSVEERARKLARSLDLRRRMMDGMQGLGIGYLNLEHSKDVDLIAAAIREAVGEEREAIASAIDLQVALHNFSPAVENAFLLLTKAIRARGDA